MTKARRNAFALAVLVCVLLVVSREAIFRRMGEYLVESQTPEKADVAIVLAGDTRGARIMRAAELVREGYAPLALVSGPFEVYGLNEADLAIQLAVRRGVPAAYFARVEVRAFSTLEEARAFLPELRKRNVHKVLLVTSDFHTRRAAEIWRYVVGPSITVRSIAAPDAYFRPESWWHNREAQKTVFYEYSKTLAYWVGL